MFYLAILIAKLTNFLIVFLKLGAGYTWPGYVATLLYPNILTEFKKRYSTKYVFITGTNGKTTTSKLISHILTKESYVVISNKSGANLLNGIVSALLLETHFLKKSKLDFCVLEIDELTLPKMLKVIEPKVLVLLNLSRDQLDRYGEVDTIMDKWLTSIRQYHAISVVIDSQQAEFQKIQEFYTGPVFYFDDNTQSLEHTNLIGDYNAKNLNAALTVCGLFGIGKERCYRALEDFSVAYGRGENVDYGGKNFRIFLAKNPSSFNNNLDLLLSSSIKYDSLIFVLNDDIRDGRDVSWIYDINTDSLNAACKDKNIFVAGTRNLDMCVRLNYADISSVKIKTESTIKNLVNLVMAEDAVQKAVILPNYSSMLEVRKILTGKEIL